MPKYAYKAVDRMGARRRGQLDAANEADLERRLQDMDLDLISVKAVPVRHFGGSRVPRRDLINFCFHLEQLTRAGVPLLEGLADLRTGLDNGRMRDVVDDLLEHIQGGKQLSEALALHPRVFDNVFVSLIAAGEKSGELPAVLQDLTETLKWQDELAAQTRRLLTYPAFAGTVVLGVSAALLVFLVPKLVDFVRGVQGELPVHTRVLFLVARELADHGHLLLAAAAISSVALATVLRGDGTAARRLDRWKLRLWLIGPVLNKIILARFARAFALLYASGLTVLECLATAEAVVGNRAVQEELRQARSRIAQGQGITASFADAGLFPPLVLSMLRVGEATGGLDPALRNVSYFYDREVREFTGRAQAMMEPALTVLLGLLLGWVMLSVLGPVYDSLGRMRL